MCVDEVAAIQILVLVPHTVVFGGSAGAEQPRLVLPKERVRPILEKVHHALEIVVRDLELARGRHCICKSAQCPSMSHLEFHIVERPSRHPGMPTDRGGPR